MGIGNGTASRSSHEISISESPVASGSGSAVNGSSGKGKEPANGKGKGSKGFKSQRPSFSCTECSRRKIRCNRTLPTNLPCTPCVNRGSSATCKLPSSDQGPPPRRGAPESAEARVATAAEMETIKQSVDQLRQQLAQLEGVLASFLPHGVDINGSTTFAYGGPRAEGAAVDKYRIANEWVRERINIEALEREGERYKGQLSDPMFDKLRDGMRLPDCDGEVEAAVTLEFLALGRDRKQDHLNRSELRRPTEGESSLLPPSWSHTRDTSPIFASSLPPSEFPLATAHPPHAQYNPSYSPVLPVSCVLPHQAQSDSIARYSLINISWQHGAVHTASFEQECVEFHGWGDRKMRLVNQAWLALYYAIMCVGVKHMDLEAARDCGLNGEDLKNLPKQFFDASVEALHRSNFLAKHSIYSVQAITVLVVTCQDVGGSDLIATLLATGIRIAQHLNLHRFTSDSDWEARRVKNGIDPRSPEGIKGLINREVRKRLWCALATEDWLSIPYRRSYAIFPSHCTTPLPTNCHESDLMTGILNPRPLSEPTGVSKLLLSMKVASCVRRFFEDMNSSGGLSYDLCLSMDREVRETIRDAPWSLQVGAEIDHLPASARFMSHYWIMSSNHKLLIIHRTFLGRKDSKYSFSRTAAIDAARAILVEFPRGHSLPFQDLWTGIFHAVAASTTLILDIFQNPNSPSEDTEKRGLVESSLRELGHLQDSSSIAARGVQLLSTLLNEESNQRSRTNGRSNKRKYSVEEGNEEECDGKAKRVSDNVSTSPTSYPEPSSSASFPPFEPTSAAHYPSALTTLASLNHFDTLFSTPAFQNLDAEGYGGFEGESNMEFWRLMDRSFDSNGRRDSAAGMEALGMGMEKDSGTWSS